MSFDNAYYKNRKDKRRPYRGAKACDRSCRNHGTCAWCKENRTVATTRGKMAAEEQLKVIREG